MENVFLLDEESCAKFLRFVMSSFGCTYICLWSYLPHPSNCLLFKDGIYHEEQHDQASSSSGSHARKLFDEYKHSVFTIENGFVPGLAFKNNLPYLQLQDSELPRLASIEPQWQFYQEARIKTAIFMGFKDGEIELGFSNDQPQVNIEMEMRKWFPDNFPSTIQSSINDQINRIPSSSNSSSLRSLSMDSPEYTSLLFNTTAPYNTMSQPPLLTTEPPSFPQATHQTNAIRFPIQETEEDAVLTRAILAVISSSSPSPCSSSSSLHHHQPQINSSKSSSSAFKSYSMSGFLGLPRSNLRVQRSMLKRAFTYYKSLNLRRIQEQHMQLHLQGFGSSRPPPPVASSNQLHHMISERKRREKLNDSFQALRSLLPPGSKRDKASVLASTREYLTTLAAQVSELTRKNMLLEAQRMPLLLAATMNEEAEASSSSSSSLNERVDVRVTPVLESTSSEERIVDLRITLRDGGDCKMDLVIRILEFLKKHVNNLSLMSMQADSIMAETTSTNRVVLRLKIEGNEWDESAFVEAVKRVIADLAQ